MTESWSSPAPTPAPGPYGGTPDALILAGAWVGVAQLAVWFLVTTIPFVAARELWREFFPAEAAGFLAWMPMVFIGLGLVGIVGVVLGFLARGRLRESGGREGGGMAIAAGALMVGGAAMIGGVLMLVGAILASQSKS